jgi:hypothetical protein
MLPCINGLHRRAQTMSSFILGTMPKTELGLYNTVQKFWVLLGSMHIGFANTSTNSKIHDYVTSSILVSRDTCLCNPTTNKHSELIFTYLPFCDGAWTQYISRTVTMEPFSPMWTLKFDAQASHRN